MEAPQISQIELQKSKAALQKARLSRAYLDAAKSFGVEKDMEFCPCFDMSTIESSTSTTGYPASMSMRQQKSYIDSESIFKILAAAGNVNTMKNNNNGISSSANQAKLSLKEIKQMGINNKHNIAARNKYYG